MVWRIVGEFDYGVGVEVRDESDNLVCEIEPFTGEWTESEIANARRIAAAPELLAALKGLLLHTESWQVIETARGDISRSHVAINKAEGV